jgi:hypothetical protein
MSDIIQFNVTEAHASYNQSDGSLNVDFYYPRHPEERTERLGPNPEFGVATLDKLIKTGKARIATEENPISPPTAGSLPVTSDGKFICNRRDDGPIVHSMYHSPYSGFAQSMDELYTANGMDDLAGRESAEELLLLTRERSLKNGKPYLIVTESTKHHTIESAKRMGLEDLTLREVKEEILPGKDTLNVLYEVGNHIYQLQTNFTMLWNIDASTIAMQIRKLDIDSSEILPMDAEFMKRGDSIIHFNRESFIVDPNSIQVPKVNPDFIPTTLEGLGYACPMHNPQVFQSYLDPKRGRIIHTPHNSPLEFLGPGKTKVNQPYLWAPQDTLRACLDALEVPGYKGKKLHWELEISKAFAERPGRNIDAGTVDESCIIPNQFRV